MFVHAIALQHADQHDVGNGGRHDCVDKRQHKRCQHQYNDELEQPFRPESQRFPAGFYVEGHQLRFEYFVAKDAVFRGVYAIGFHDAARI